MEIVIVTGMSGAGKSQAVESLEDVGFYCVDNVPPRLLLKFAELPLYSHGSLSRIALVVDVRSRDMFAEYRSCLAELSEKGYTYKTLFLDCDDRTLLRRYKETRRKHPLTDENLPDTERAIRDERVLLNFARQNADYVIDTSMTSASQLKSRIKEIFSSGVNSSMTVSCRSFGFKHGTPVDADLMFDVRCMPNPFYIDELREYTGLDAPVRDYVMSFKEAQELVPKLFDLIDYLIPLYCAEGKSQLVIAVGCTGGKHRSVVFTELLAAHLKEKGSRVFINHRDKDRANKG